MEKKQKIVQYRERLDKTLASPDLTNEEKLKNIVRNQFLSSYSEQITGFEENIIEKRTAEVSQFLDMLRSASVDDSERSKTSHTDWKLKQDNEEFRVMYREGPEGTPFHTMLVEGYVDGPVDVCLCISWETFLYKKWWPQSTVPSFKIISAECLQKVGIREQISLVRVKVSWPLSMREAVLHYYLFEYFQDDLIVVLVNTVPESNSINETLHGFNNEAIPEAKDVVRIDVIGGFALQKVTAERSYFRTISNMDIKLDFVPPSFINFVSRQLIGNGFRLYQKAVTSMKSQDNEFSEALGDPLYARIREALYDVSRSKMAMDEEELEQNGNILPGKAITEPKAKDVSQEDSQHANNCMSPKINAVVPDNSKAFGEIEEADSEEIVPFKEDDEKVNDIPVDEVDAMSLLKGKRHAHMSSEVEKALETLENAISIVRQYGYYLHKSSSLADEKSQYMGKLDLAASYSPKFVQNCSKGEICTEASNQEIQEGASKEAPGSNSSIHSLRYTGTNSDSKEVTNYNKVVPASPEQNLSRPNETSRVALSPLKNVGTTLDETIHSNKQLNGTAIQRMSSNKPKKPSRLKKFQYFCFLPQFKKEN